MGAVDGEAGARARPRTLRQSAALRRYYRVTSDSSDDRVTDTPTDQATLAPIQNPRQDNEQVFPNCRHPRISPRPTLPVSDHQHFFHSHHC